MQNPSSVEYRWVGVLLTYWGSVTGETLISWVAHPHKYSLTVEINGGANLEKSYIRLFLSALGSLGFLPSAMNARLVPCMMYDARMHAFYLFRVM